MFAKQIEISEITALYSRMHAEKIAAAGLYSYVKSIAEETRAVAKKLHVPIISASQLNRDATNNVDGADVKIFKINFTEDEKDEAIIYAGVNVQRMLVENETK